MIVLEQLEVDYVLFKEPPVPTLTISVLEIDAIVTRNATKKAQASKDKADQDTRSKSAKQPCDKAKKYTKDNKTVRGHILNHMANLIFDLLYNMKSTKDIWNLLKVKYGADDAGMKKYVIESWQPTGRQPIMDQVHTYENLTVKILAESMEICKNR
ncbi:hypothetical protein LINGRAHAP2_LOCUS31787, partial [Linum grandiflorum]